MLKSKGSSVRLDIAWPGKQKSALRDALLAVQGVLGWTIRVSSTLVYAERLMGTWWWKVALSGPGAGTQTLLVEPGHQTIEFVVDLVERAIAGELLTVVCSSCGRVAIGGIWQRREDVKNHARLTHGLCPECAEKLYPGAVRRIRARRKN